MKRRKGVREKRIQREVVREESDEQREGRGEMRGREGEKS